MILTHFPGWAEHLSDIKHALEQSGQKNISYFDIRIYLVMKEKI
jgi:hypothetical protein